MADNNDIIIQEVKTVDRKITSDVETRVIVSNVQGVATPGSSGGGAEVVFPNVDFVNEYEVARGPKGGGGGVTVPASQIVMHFTSPPNYSGATLADVNAVSGDLDIDGLHAVSGGGVEYIGLYSEDPGGGNWVHFESSWNPWSFTPGDTVSGFHTALLESTNALDGAVFSGCGRNSVVGESFTIKARIGPATDGTKDLGATIYVRLENGTTKEVAYCTSLSPTSGDANWILNTTDNHVAAAATFIAKSHNASEDWQEYVFNWANLVGYSPLSFAGVSGSDAVDPDVFRANIFGLQVVKGALDQNWYATSNTTVTVGSDTDFGFEGAIDTMLKGTASSIVIEIGQHHETDTYPTGHIFSHGASGLTTVIDITGMGSIAGPNAEAAVVGSGGFLGIVRVGLTRDASGHSISINGGVVKNVSNLLNFSNTIKLFKNKTGVIRSIDVWDTRITDAQLKAATEIIGRAYAQLPDNVLYYPTTVTQTFFDDFVSNTIRQRINPPYDPTIAPVTYTTSLTPQYDKTGNWIPRYHNHMNSAKGSGRNNSNNEYQEYMDPQYPSNYNPFDWGIATASCLTITASKTSSLGTSQQSLVDNRWANNADTGTKYPYVSGCLTTMGKFEQRYGYFEARVKVPTTSNGSLLTHISPEFWTLPNDEGTRSEFDIFEMIGDGITGHDWASYHVNQYAINDIEEITHPYNMGNDFHTYGMLWTASYIEFYRDGKMYFHRDIEIGENADDLPHYLLLNLAIGGTTPGVPDSNTDNSMPAKMIIDYVRAFRLS